ncbi:SIMPL domain-containing protein [Marinobacter zhanjiangensis]|uniref:SIMPL domain-containing protein n=1 Tax=Marinobacter zhanjiangensis TaxID=578215 RepID=A0ABQ3AVC0_9GAMM|nr:SIMPL domain-containing protein [Marinobacter zhanjiangensis]GGY65696.1 SIMPL domain-containing protein [Marinobacter zhanjiangensis]
MKVLVSVVIGLSLIVAASLLRDGLTELRTGDRYVTVKGVAEKEVTADLALWPIRFAASGNTLEAAREKARSSRDGVMAFLSLQAISEEAVELQRMDVVDTQANNPYQPENGARKVIITQVLMVRTDEVDKVRQAARNVSDLVDSGVVLSSDYGPAGPTYLFTRLNDIKPEMISEATLAARESAQQFARDADAELGGLRRANQGVFQILARDQAPGVTADQQPFKTVRVVSTFDYYLQ